MGAASRILATLPVIDDGENLERDRVVLSRIERAVLGHALSLFLDQLPSDVLTAMRTEGAVTVEAFNHYLDVNGKPHRNRIQAVQAFPLFGARLRTDWQLRRMVDRGQPLTRALAAAHQVQPRTIQCCRTLSAARAPDERRADLLNQLDRLPAEYLPKTEQDWTAFLDLAGSLGDLAATLHTDLVPLIKPFAAGWHSGRTLLSQKLGADFSVQPIYEMMHAVYRYGLYYPALKAQNPSMSLLAPEGNAPPPIFFPRWLSTVQKNSLPPPHLGQHEAEILFDLEGLSVQQESQHTEKGGSKGVEFGDEALKDVESVAKEAELRSLERFFWRMGWC
jgi:hypothetical protein